jgi:hypothetical protein
MGYVLLFAALLRSIQFSTVQLISALAGATLAETGHGIAVGFGRVSDSVNSVWRQSNTLRCLRNEYLSDNLRVLLELFLLLWTEL